MVHFYTHNPPFFHFGHHFFISQIMKFVFENLDEEVKKSKSSESEENVFQISWILWIFFKTIDLVIQIKLT